MTRQKPKPTERHIRWNFEESPDTPEETLLHLVAVDNKYVASIFERILGQNGVSFGAVAQERELKGKVKGTRLQYLFRTYQGFIDPRKISWDKTGKIAFQDTDLRERKSKAFSIEDYVRNIYSPEG
jgi:hypothetical protein